MGILTRFVRICKADVHGVMDHLEDEGLLLRQHLREMNAALEQKEQRLRKMTASREQLLKQCHRCVRENEKLEQDLTMAIRKEEDRIARMLIRKIKFLEGHRDALERHLELLTREVDQLTDCLKIQQRQYQELQLRADDYFRRNERRRWEMPQCAVSPDSSLQPVSEEEIELELIKRKQALGGGGQV